MPQARRALDYLVGLIYPLYCGRRCTSLSAGRVQSCTALNCEREAEIEAFVAQEYWTITADLKHKQPFSARLHTYKGEKVEQFSVTNAEKAESVEKHLSQCAKGKLLVTKVDKKQRKRHPSPPFITSTLQQDASRKLGFSPANDECCAKAMKVLR